MISPVGYTSYIYPSAGVNAIGNAVNPVTRVKGVSPVSENSRISVGDVKPQECQTCKNRKYVDQSGESNVSFKTPAHISPEASFSAVSAHEAQHVSNAVSEGSKSGRQLISASVSLKMEICPECGKPYIAGGVTTTQIRYEEGNPYEDARKSVEGSVLKGMNVDYVA
jgi:hypothetical protein